MGDAISSFLFQPPTPSKLKESKIIWLSTSRGTRIPACYIEAVKSRRGNEAHSRSPKEMAAAGRRARDGGGAAAAAGGDPDAAVTILYSHANAEDLGNIYPWCKFLSKSLGVNVLAYDYTGYGLATEQGAFRVRFILFVGGCSGWPFVRLRLRSGRIWSRRSGSGTAGQRGQDTGMETGRETDPAAMSRAIWDRGARLSSPHLFSLAPSHSLSPSLSSDIVRGTNGGVACRRFPRCAGWIDSCFPLLLLTPLPP